PGSTMRHFSRLPRRPRTDVPSRARSPATSSSRSMPACLQTDGMATSTSMEQLVDELERNYRETQERMSDPAVYNDHREAAEVGRRLKELEAPYKLAERWRSASADLRDAGADVRSGCLQRPS